MSSEIVNASSEYNTIQCNICQRRDNSFSSLWQRAIFFHSVHNFPWKGEERESKMNCKWSQVNCSVDGSMRLRYGNWCPVSESASEKEKKRSSSRKPMARVYLSDGHEGEQLHVTLINGQASEEKRRVRERERESTQCCRGKWGNG